MILGQAPRLTAMQPLYGQPAQTSPYVGMAGGATPNYGGGNPPFGGINAMQLAQLVSDKRTPDQKAAGDNAVASGTDAMQGLPIASSPSLGQTIGNATGNLFGQPEMSGNDMAVASGAYPVGAPSPAPQQPPQPPLSYNQVMPAGALSQILSGQSNAPSLAPASASQAVQGAASPQQTSGLDPQTMQGLYAALSNPSVAQAFAG